MSCPASMRAASAGTAKSGVPMKARRRRALTAPRPLGGGNDAGSDGLDGLAALRFHQLAQDDVALQRRDVIDEEDALEMIHLVLDDGSEQALRLERAHLVLVVE